MQSSHTDLQFHFRTIAKALNNFEPTEERKMQDLGRVFQNGIMEALNEEKYPNLNKNSVPGVIRNDENAKNSAQKIKDFLEKEAEIFYREFVALSKKVGTPNAGNILCYYEIYLNMARRVTLPLLAEINSTNYPNLSLKDINAICGAFLHQMMLITNDFIIYSK